jgi:uncharacterized sulfatase
MMKYLVLALSVIGCFWTGCADQEKDNQPNIVWIIAEDLSQDLGTYGNKLVHTPNIDGLAKRGVKFTNVFTTAPICTPSRTALAVGMHPGSFGGHHMRYPDSLKPDLPEGVWTMNRHFQKNGYVTANITDDQGNGKTDWSFETNMNQQFDFNTWKELADQSKPFFAQINIHYSHRPFPENDSNEIDEQKINIPPYYPDHPVTRHDFANYYKSVEKLDTEVGRVLDTIKQYGFENNTIILFFSDHGRPMTRGKSFIYDSGIKIPAILHIPAQVNAPEEYGSKVTEEKLISAIDFTATTLSLAGIGKRENMHGRIFWGNNKDPERQYIYSAVDRTGESHFKSRAIRSKEYKYIRNYRHDYTINEMATAYRKANHPIYHLLNILDEQGELEPAQQYLVDDLPEEELYHVKKDPYEINNLAENSEHQDIRQKLKNKLKEHLKQIDDQGLEADSKQIETIFEQYGKQSIENRREKIQQLHKQVMKQLKSE